MWILLGRYLLRKVACCSQSVETRHNRRAIDGCRLRVRSKAYSASSHKRGVCVGFWRDRAANVCLASVYWCIFHVNQLPSSRRPNMALAGNEFEESMPNTRTQTTSRILLLQTYIRAAGLVTWGVGPDVRNNVFLIIILQLVVIKLNHLLTKILC